MGVKNEQKTNAEKYELRAPDGGWGYVIVLATVTLFCCTQIPMFAFGLIFGDFLKTIGDETTGTSLCNGMFNTVQSFTGLIANGLLNKYSYRKVGFAGAIIFLLGASGLFFSKNLIQMITFFGVVQGLGFGLMFPAVLTAFNSYFVDKMALMMSIAQALTITGCILVPQVATWSMNLFGFRGTLIGLAVLALLCLPAMLTLQPVEWHMNKVPVAISTINDTVVPIEDNLQNKKAASTEVLKSQVEPLLNQNKHMTVSQRSLNYPKPRRSIISLGDRVASVTAINRLRDNADNDAAEKDDLSIWQSFVKSMDMSLLKDPKYLSVSGGLALCFTADVAFISIIPLMLANAGFQQREAAFMITVFFGSDLVSRLLLTVVSGFVKFRSRYLVLTSALLSAIFRTVLVANDTYMWKMCILGILGFLRCFIQTPLPLVISEEYSDNFATAFSLYMAVNGVVSLTFGLLMSFIKSWTHSDVMVCHALTVAFGICVITWILEMTFFQKKSQNEQKK